MQRYKVFQIIQVFGMIIGEAVAAYSDAATIYHFPILGDSSFHCDFIQTKSSGKRNRKY